jgi:hypothetical protein
MPDRKVTKYPTAYPCCSTPLARPSSPTGRFSSAVDAARPQMPSKPMPAGAMRSEHYASSERQVRTGVLGLFSVMAFATINAWTKEKIRQMSSVGRE